MIFLTHIFAILGFIGSGIAIVRAFGIFCLIIVPIHFLFIIFYFPSWLVLHEKYIKKLFDCVWDCLIDFLFCRKKLLTFDCLKCDFSCLKCDFSNFFNCNFCCFKCECDCNCFK